MAGMHVATFAPEATTTPAVTTPATLEETPASPTHEFEESTPGGAAFTPLPEGFFAGEVPSRPAEPFGPYRRQR